MRFNRNTGLFLVISLGVILLAVLFLSKQSETDSTEDVTVRPLFGGGNVTDIISFSVR